MQKCEKNDIIWYEFAHFSQTGLINHCYTTRIGGVSEYPYKSMNLAYHMGDDPKKVDENFNRISATLGFDTKNLKMTTQIHGNTLFLCSTSQDQVADGVDGLITNIPNMTLTTYHADCVGILFFDPVKKVIANAHAGWQGTAQQIGVEIIKKMTVHYGCRVENILVGIAPAICGNCFEIEKDVTEKLGIHSPYVQQKSDHKWTADLQAINRGALIDIGVLEKNIEVAQLCTVEHPELFFSHRRDGIARGNMAAMIALK